MSEARGETVLARWYRERIAEPQTDDEVYGYWLFVFGVLIGIFGVLLAATTAGQTGTTFQRLAGIALGGVGLIFLLLGTVIRLPLERRAIKVAYAGAAIALVAVVWLVLTFEGGRAQRSSIMGLYGIGLAVVAAGAALVPMLSEADGSAAREAARAASADAAAAREEADAAREDAAAAGDEADDLREEVAALEAELADAGESRATFELYEDRGGKYRWRLRHRNGNVVADSGQGYTRRANAQNGLASVRRNALGAALVDLDEELEEPIEAADEGVVAYPPGESQGTFEVYEDEGGEYRWRLRHRNGEIIADGGQGYDREADAVEAVERVGDLVGQAAYLRADPTAFEVYRDAADEWRWRLVHKNGRVLADSGEGYASRSNARRAVDTVRDAMAGDGSGEFEVYEDASGDYRWRLVAGNGEIIADGGQGFIGEEMAEDSIERVRGHSADADVLDIGRAAFEVYKDAGNDFRWRLRHRNGNILADSGEGYASRTNAFDGIDSVKRNAPNADVESA
ncbi:YegP family protein [Halomicrobium salinisoli]|uniref:YegP family protein n=1 Tax=Halomicrobium salinisoli TaxID=2878391 RepID=UPI001CF05596|nr:YegP family protein [Halomicrobium salinisoli]